MYNSRKSSQNLMSEALPRPGQVSSLRNSDNNQYGFNAEINMSKSNVFFRSEMPQQLTFKNNQNFGKTSNIFNQGQSTSKLAFKSSTSGIKKYNTPTSTHSTQSEAPLNFKGKTDSKLPEVPKLANFSIYRKLSDDGSFESKTSQNQSNADPCVSHSSNGAGKLQFRQNNQTHYMSPSKPILDGSPHSQGQINLRPKPNIQQALKESLGSYSNSIQQISQSQNYRQGEFNGGRLQRYRKKTFKDFTQNSTQNFILEQSYALKADLTSNVAQNQQFNYSSQSIFQSNYKPAVSISGTTANPYQKAERSKEVVVTSPVISTNSFYYYSYPHPGFVNPYNKESKQFKIESVGSTPSITSHLTTTISHNNDYGPSPLQSPNIPKTETIENQLQQKLNRITPNSHNSNFSKFKNNSIGASSGKHSSGFKQRSIPKLSVGVNDFKLGKKLGKGKFGDVYLAQDIKTGFIFALKIIKKKTLIDERVDHQFTRQLKIQFFLNHPNLISLYGFFDDETSFYMVLEYAADGHLFGILRQKKRLNQNEAKTLVKQVCEGVEYMHSQRILHRDLKPQNVLIQFGIPKICDFGWAIYRADTLRDTFCGTPLYISPQILTGQKYDQGADLWAVGILTYQLLVGKIPFKIKSQHDLIKIVNQEIVFPQHVPLSNMSKDFVMRMLDRDPQTRFDIEQLLNHPFLAYKEVSKPLP